MNGLSVAEIAKSLGIGSPAAKMRLRVAGIKPKEYVGQAAIYDESALEAIRTVRSKGRPKKQPEPDNKAKSAKKAKK